MFFKCICKITFIKWDSDKHLNLQSAQQSSTITGIGQPPLKLCVSLYLVCDYNLVCEPDFQSSLWELYMPFAMALANAICSEKRNAKKNGNLEKKNQQKQTNTNESTAHKGFQSVAYIRYNPKKKTTVELQNPASFPLCYKPLDSYQDAV